MNTQKKIIKELGVKSEICPKKEFFEIVDSLKKFLRKNKHLRTLVLGISGGQDSTLTGKICQTVIKELKSTKNHFDNYKFIALRLPCGTQTDELDCQNAIKFINPDQLLTINIKNSIENNFLIYKNLGFPIRNIIRENEKARERMKIQYSIAKLTSGAVIGTCHAAEIVTGFFTKYGDGGTDFNPISHLNKRQGRHILEYLKCPSNLYLKNPIADSEESFPSLPDEDVLGITYDVIDDYLEGKIVNSTQSCIIESLYFKTQHKRFSILNNKFFKNG